MRGHIDRLQRLSNAIRLSAAEARAIRVSAFWAAPEQTEENREIQNFEDRAKNLARYYNPNISEWLCNRVGITIALRRKRILYNQKHKHKLRLSNIAPRPQQSIAPTQEPTVQIFQDKKPSKTVQFDDSVVARPSVSRIRPATNASKAAMSQFRMPRSQATTMKSSYSSQGDTRLPIPPPKIPEGVNDFECPFCSFILPVTETTDRRWRFVSLIPPRRRSC